MHKKEEFCPLCKRPVAHPYDCKSPADAEKENRCWFSGILRSCQAKAIKSKMVPAKKIDNKK